MSLGDLWEKEILRSPALRRDAGFQPMVHQNFKIPRHLRKGLEDLVTRGIHANVSEAIREAVRNLLRDYAVPPFGKEGV